MTKLWVMFMAIALFATGYVTTNAKADQTMSAGEELTINTEEMADEAQEEFNADVDCAKEVMEGAEVPEDCISKDNADKAPAPEMEADDSMIEY